MVSSFGRLSIHMDGRWDIEDLFELSDALKDTYAYFFVVARAGSEDNEPLERLLADHFWRGQIGRWRVEQRLYNSIPGSHALKIASIRYASPGVMEVAGSLGVLLLMAKVANAWLDVGSRLVETYEKIEKFFRERKHLTRQRTQIKLDGETAYDVDKSRELMFELGKAMGYSDTECESILDMVGNPIAGLRLMVALAGETRKIADLSSRGLLKLPDMPKPEE